jgi:hypothetical protein
MKNNSLMLACLLTFAALPVTAADTQDPAARRKELLGDMLTSDPASAIATQRWVCAMGQEPASVADFRSSKLDATPDASDTCVTALIRTAHDHQLPEFYKKFLTRMGVGDEGYEKLPHRIGAAVLSGNQKVAISGDKVIPVTPALAFDAGFSVAYLESAAKSEGINEDQLKKVSESCLAQGEDAKTCFSMGYVYGARAVGAQ